MNLIEAVVTFLVMWLVGIVLNPMNLLAFQWDHLYISRTLAYIGFIMASNMMWVHAALHYAFGHSSVSELITMGLFGIVLSITAVVLARHQIGIGADAWMQRMIPHHSTALTTTTQLLQNHGDTMTEEQKELAQTIIREQTKEIEAMKAMLRESARPSHTPLH